MEASVPGISGSKEKLNEGPSDRAVAWRFLIETLVCLVLVAMIVTSGLQARHNPLAGPAILALVAAIVGILR
jgi:hypothetical protein